MRSWGRQVSDQAFKRVKEVKRRFHKPTAWSWNPTGNIWQHVALRLPPKEWQ